MIDTSQVTIIIPHLGANEESRRSLKLCLESLDETVPDIKKIVAFNGLGEDSPLQFYPTTENIWLEKQGQCKAVNAAVATTNTQWIFVSNDDHIYAPGWWEKLTNFPSDILCISPRLIEPRPGAPTFGVYFCGGAGGDFDKVKWLEFVKNYQPDEFSMQTGFNLPFLIRRDLWDTIGGYDINYDPWGSNGDSDIAYKLKLAGVQPYQNTNCIVYHFSQTSGTFEPRNDSYRFANYAYFEEKWGFPRTDDGIWEATFEIPEPPIRKFTPTWEGKYK